MADNTTLNSGTGGDIIASDDIGGIKFQRVKLVQGSDGVNDGDISSAAPLQVTLANGSVPTHGVTLAAGAAAIAKAEDVASANADVGVPAMAIRKATPANTSDTDGDYEMLQISGGRLWASVTIDAALPAGTNNIGDVDVLSVPAPLNVVGNGTAAAAMRVTVASDSTGAINAVGTFVTCSTDITRPADTTAYAANDALSNSTSAPTTGGFTLSNAARQSGGSGIITDVIVTSSNDPATTLQGEIWIFDEAVTNINDNAAFAVSDTEIKTCVGKVPFTLEDAGNNGFYHAQNLGIGFTCVGSADLRFLVRVKNAYTPANAEVITVVVKILQVT